MKYNKIINLLLISTQALLISAEKVTFKVLAINGTPILKIDGGKQYPMNAEHYPLYSVTADVDLPVNYNYMVDYGNGESETEEFLRKREKNDETLNEFFNRSVTVVDHPELPRAYEAFPYSTSSKLYDDSHVATIVVSCDPNELNSLYQNPEILDKYINAEVIYASPYKIKSFKQAQFGISGQSTRHVPKLSYKIKNLSDENNKELFGRSAIKLRAEHMDPSFLRDKIYGDILNSLGVPTTQNKLARLFINGEAVGLFDISDSVSNGRYLRETFNKGEKYKNVNPLFKADYCPTCDIGVAYGDLGYYGNDVNEPMYSIYTYKGSDKTLDSTVHVSNELIPLLQEIDSYVKGENENMPLDTDSFLKYMAMEYLAGAVDNYWNKPGNYYVFKDTEKNQWYFHDTDFHFSFGVGGQEELMLNTPLAEYPPILEEGVGRERAPLDGLLNRPDQKDRFIRIFERLLKTSFNPSALFPRIDSLANLIREDAYWDFSLPKVNQAEELADTQLVYEPSDFDTHVSSEQPQARFNTMPLKYFINTMVDNISKELNINVPKSYETNLGFVENTADVNSGAMTKLSWSIFSVLISVFFALLFY